jgi:Protein of unknown function (DUF3617)
MMKMHTTLAALLLALPLAASAQSRPTPGLWEQNAKMGSADPKIAAAMAQMQQQMAAMPPEQRKQMEEMMAKQGMSMPGGGPGGGMSVKYCLTPEKAARDEIPMDQDPSCKQTSMNRSGNTIKFTVECTGQRAGKGEGEITFISPKEHKGKMKLTSARGGRDQTMEIEHHAKWLAADCGAIKPR